MKNLLILALAILCGWLAFKWYRSERQAYSVRTMKEAAQKAVTTEAEIIAREVDSNGVEHAIISGANNVMQGTTLYVLDSASKKSLDSAMRIIGIKDRQLSAYHSVNASLRDSLLEARKTPTGYDYRDKWAYLSFTSPTLTDSAKFSFRYNAEVNMVEYWDRANFLSPKRQYIDLWLSDPRATINSVKRLKIEPTPDRFSLSVQALGDYHPKHGAGLGAGARVQIGRIGLQGAYLYDGQQWYPAFRGSYDLIAW